MFFYLVVPNSILSLEKNDNISNLILNEHHYVGVLSLNNEDDGVLYQ